MTNEKATEILNEAIKTLEDASRWTKQEEFGAECSATQTTFSLACALKLAHIKVTGVFESRSVVMEKVRGKIRRHFLLRHGIHPIYSFNKHRKTTHFEVLFILQNAKKDFR